MTIPLRVETRRAGQCRLSIASSAFSKTIRSWASRSSSASRSKARSCAGGRAAARRLPRSNGARPEAVVCDIRLPDMSGEDVFRAVADRDAAPPFLFITGYGDIDQAVQPDPVRRRRLPDQAVRNAGLPRPAVGSASAARRRRAVGARRFRSRCAPSSGRCCGVARVRATVLLTGETGVGKEVSRPLPPRRERRDRAVHGRQLRGHSRRPAGGRTLRSRARRVHRRAGSPSRLRRAGRRRHALPRRDRRPCARRCRRSCCASSKSASSTASAAKPPFRSAPASSARPMPTLRSGCAKVASAKICSTGSTSSRSPFRLCATARRTSAGCSTGSSTSSTSSSGDLAGVSGLAEEAALGHPWPGNVRELRNRVERAVALALGPWLMPGDLFPEAADASRMPRRAAVA